MFTKRYITFDQIQPQNCQEWCTSFLFQKWLNNRHPFVINHVQLNYVDLIWLYKIYDTWKLQYLDFQVFTKRYITFDQIKPQNCQKWCTIFYFRNIQLTNYHSYENVIWFAHQRRYCTVWLLASVFLCLWRHKMNSIWVLMVSLSNVMYTHYLKRSNVMYTHFTNLSKVMYEFDTLC